MYCLHYMIGSSKRNRIFAFVINLAFILSFHTFFFLKICRYARSLRESISHKVKGKLLALFDKRAISNSKVDEYLENIHIFDMLNIAAILGVTNIPTNNVSQFLAE